MGFVCVSVFVKFLCFDADEKKVKIDRTLKGLISSN